MPITLDTPANEESTYPVVVTFRDEAGALMVPSSATWTLTTRAGAVINERETVAIDTLASSVTIVLSGEDLSMPAGAGDLRSLTIEATYTSSLGTGLPFKEEIRFSVEELIAIT
jgi:hypothetical protein